MLRAIYLRLRRVRELRLPRMQRARAGGGAGRAAVPNSPTASATAPGANLRLPRPLTGMESDTDCAYADVSGQPRRRALRDHPVLEGSGSGGNGNPDARWPWLERGGRIEQGATPAIAEDAGPARGAASRQRLHPRARRGPRHARSAYAIGSRCDRACRRWQRQTPLWRPTGRNVAAPCRSRVRPAGPIACRQPRTSSPSLFGAARDWPADRVQHGRLDPSAVGATVYYVLFASSLRDSSVKPQADYSLLPGMSSLRTATTREAAATETERRAPTAFNGYRSMVRAPVGSRAVTHGPPSSSCPRGAPCKN